MKKNDNKDKKTVFRKIGGRVVPISIGAGTIYAAKSLNKIHRSYNVAAMINNSDHLSEKGKYKNKFFNKKDLSYLSTKLSSRKEKLELLKRVYKKHIGDDLDIKYQDSKQSNYFHRGIKIGNEKRPWIAIKTVDQSTFLHELGHYKQYKNNSITEKIVNKIGNGQYLKNKIDKKILHFSSAITHKIKNKKLQSIIFKNTDRLRNIGYKIATDLYDMANISHETDAWFKALKMAKTRRAKKSVIKGAKIALSTYIPSRFVTRAKYGIFALGASFVGYGLLKRDSN